MFQEADMFKTILLYLPSADAAESVATSAAKLAERHGALLIGAHHSIKIVVYGGVPENILGQQEARERELADAVRVIFEDVARRQNIAHEWRHRTARDTDAFRDVVAQSHAADLVVVPGKDFSDPLGHWFDLPERLVMESGRPILLIPRERTFDSFGKRVMIAWDGSREAARAAFDALPFLRQADAVFVTTAGDTQQPAASAAAFTANLQRHGVKAETVVAASGGKSDSEALRTALADRNCDMLVMGFYGHSRLREMVFGGFTRDVLKNMTVPVLTAH
jgi:nucleotide-binding universal stress UspA family protein